VNGRALNLLGLALVGIVGIAFMILTPRFAELDTVLELTVYMVMAILSLSLALIWAMAAFLCFGQSAFFGLGAYAYAIAMFNVGDSTIPVLLAIALPAAFAALLGYFMFYGRISDVYLRRHHADGHLDPVQLGQFHRRSGIPYRHRAAWRFQRIPGIPPLNLPGDKTAVIDLEGMFYLATASLLVTYFGLRLLLASRFGPHHRRHPRERAARGVAGLRSACLQARDLHHRRRAGRFRRLPVRQLGNFVSPTIFGLSQSAQIIIWVLVGGRGTLIGPVSAASASNGSAPRSAPTSRAAAPTGGRKSSPMRH